MNTTANTESGKTAWVAGATGLIGRHLLQQLCDEARFDRVIAFVRSNRSLGFDHPKLSTYLCDWDALTQLGCDADRFAPPTEHVDALFCAIGSTKKKTPDKATYRTIDIEYPIAFAKLGKRHGARFYGLVSAHGADTSMPSFYLNMKKEAEQRLRETDFPHTAIARPSLLLGERDEFRLGESVSEWICKRLPGNYKAIEGQDVAAALILSERDHRAGCEILNSASMQGAFERLSVKR